MNDVGHTSPLTNRLGFPLHALITGIPIGILGAATAFDIASQFTATPCSDFPRPAFWLISLGLVTGVAAGIFGLLDLRRLDNSSPAYATATKHVIATDVALALYAVSLLLRRGSVYCEAVKPIPTILSVLGALVLLAGMAFGTRLVFRFGVGVQAQDAAVDAAKDAAADVAVAASAPPVDHDATNDSTATGDVDASPDADDGEAASDQ